MGFFLLTTDNKGLNGSILKKPSIKCDICKKSFKYKSHFILHQRVHTGEKSFKCDYCDKSFSQKGNLTTHMLVHSGKKDFQCHVCHKYFAEKI